MPKKKEPAVRQRQTQPARAVNRAGDRAGDASADRNDVVLVGRLAACATARELPSGSVLSSWRLVVRRAQQPADAGVRRQSVDTLDCVAWRPALQTKVAGLAAGDVVEVTGALHRRFWQGPGGLASRYEVEASSIRRLRRAPA